MLRELPVVIPPGEGDPPAGLNADHPMRAVTRAVAFDAGGWTPERRSEVAALFDDLAPDWHTRHVPERLDPLRDALDRGVAAAPVADRRVAVDVGAGTGLFTEVLVGRFEVVLAVDLACEMLRHHPGGGAQRLQADAAVLPVADGTVDVLVLVNAFLFPAEVHRALSPVGAVVWVNSRGSDTPIHLPATDVDAALGEGWDGVGSSAGWGTWSVHWRGR